MLKTGTTTRRVLLACAKAIKALEEVTGGGRLHTCTEPEQQAINDAKKGLWDVLIWNGQTIDLDTNQLAKAFDAPTPHGDDPRMVTTDYDENA